MKRNWKAIAGCRSTPCSGSLSSDEVMRLNRDHCRRIQLLKDAAIRNDDLATAIVSAKRLFIFDGWRLMLSQEIRPAVPAAICAEFDSQPLASNPPMR